MALPEDPIGHQNGMDFQGSLMQLETDLDPFDLDL